MNDLELIKDENVREMVKDIQELNFKLSDLWKSVLIETLLMLPFIIFFGFSQERIIRALGLGMIVFTLIKVSFPLYAGFRLWLLKKKVKMLLLDL